jgi:hypothetical protein
MLNGQPVEVDTIVQVVFSLVQQTSGQPVSSRRKGPAVLRTSLPIFIVAR